MESRALLPRTGRADLRRSRVCRPAALPGGDLPVAEFAFPGPLRDQFAAAVLAGEKTTTTGLVAEYGHADDPLPAAGLREVAVDPGCGEPMSPDCRVGSRCRERRTPGAVVPAYDERATPGPALSGPAVPFTGGSGWHCPPAWPASRALPRARRIRPALLPGCGARLTARNVPGGPSSPGLPRTPHSVGPQRRPPIPRRQSPNSQVSAVSY